MLKIQNIKNSSADLSSNINYDPYKTTLLMHNSDKKTDYTTYGRWLLHEKLHMQSAMKVSVILFTL